MNKEEGARSLVQNGWLSRTRPDFQRALLAIATWREVEAGETVGLTGDLGGNLCGVASGQVGYANGLGSSITPVVQIGHAGSWVGILPIFGIPRASDTTARTAALVASMPIARVHALLDEHPNWWRHIADLALEFTLTYATAMTDLMIRDSRQRCIAVLLRVGGCRFQDVALAAPPTVVLTQEELSAMANLSPYPTGKILRELDRQGLIKLGYRSVKLLQPATLRASLIDMGL